MQNNWGEGRECGNEMGIFSKTHPSMECLVKYLLGVRVTMFHQHVLSWNHIHCGKKSFKGHLHDRQKI